MIFLSGGCETLHLGDARKRGTVFEQIQETHPAPLFSPLHHGNGARQKGSHRKSGVQLCFSSPKSPAMK